MLFKALFHFTRKARWLLGGIWARIVLRGFGVEFGGGLKIGSPPFIRRNLKARIVLGQSVTILNTIEENPAGIAHRTVLCAAEPGAELLIGNNVGISGAILFAWRRIEIGDRVSIGAGAAVYDADFHALDPVNRHKNVLSDMGIAPVVIKSDAWLGARSMVLKGVTVGKCAIVGAGAVVTKDVPDGAIVAGVPARVVGYVSNAVPDKASLAL